MYPAIAANPYFAFNAIATESGTFEFTWSGDNGFTKTESVAIKVE
jgi:sulfur-oxidizing protein SoxZ